MKRLSVIFAFATLLSAGAARADVAPNPPSPTAPSPLPTASCVAGEGCEYTSAAGTPTEGVCGIDPNCNCMACVDPDSPAAQYQNMGQGGCNASLPFGQGAGVLAIAWALLCKRRSGSAA